MSDNETDNTSSFVCRSAVSNAILYAEHYIWSQDAAICVSDGAGNVVETHEHKGEFKES